MFLILELQLGVTKIDNFSFGVQQISRAFLRTPRRENGMEYESEGRGKLE